MRISFTIAACLVPALPALAAPPQVVTDIGPIQSLAAQVMDGVGEPTVLMQPGASPHHYAMRPSEALALQEADLVFWVGEPLTPWLGDAIATLGTSAATVELLEAEGTVVFEPRETAVFAERAGDHDHDHEDHAGHDHGDHDHEAAGSHAHEDDDHGHSHEEHAEHDHDDHAGHDHGHGHAHDHGGVDPHAWLSPENGKTWLSLMAEALAEADPDNAATYRANAEAGIAAIDAAAADATEILATSGDVTYVVYHDAYRYYEEAFGLAPLGAIAESDAREAGPRRLETLRQAIADTGVTCIFAEPQFNSGLIDAALSGTPAREAVIDPLGSTLEQGKDLYPEMIRNIAETIAGCGTSG